MSRTRAYKVDSQKQTQTKRQQNKLCDVLIKRRDMKTTLDRLRKITQPRGLVGVVPPTTTKKNSRYSQS